VLDVIFQARPSTPATARGYCSATAAAAGSRYPNGRWATPTGCPRRPLRGADALNAAATASLPERVGAQRPWAIDTRGCVILPSRSTHLVFLSSRCSDVVRRAGNLGRGRECPTGAFRKLETKSLAERYVQGRSPMKSSSTERDRDALASHDLGGTSDVPSLSSSPRSRRRPGPHLCRRRRAHRDPPPCPTERDRGKTSRSRHRRAQETLRSEETQWPPTPRR
jgi:hypothetical protein